MSAASIEVTITVNPLANTLTYETPLPISVNEIVTLIMNGKNNIQPITYTSSNIAIATVSNGQVTTLTSGTVTITATQVASTTVSGKSVEVTITVNPLANTLAYVTSISEYIHYTFPLPMTGTRNNLQPITYSSSNSNATVASDGQVTTKAPGRVTITASQIASDTVSGTTIEVTIIVKPLYANTLSYETLITTYVNDTFTLNMNGTKNNTQPITYSSNNPAIASVSEGQVITNAPGTVILTVSQVASYTVSGVNIEIILNVSYIKNVDDTYTLFKYTGTDTIVTLDVYQGIPITVIADNAFKDTNVTQVNLPEGLLTIGAGAFQNTQLTGVFSLPTSLQIIGENAFKNAGRFSTPLILPTNVTIGANAFEGCSFTFTF